MEYENMATWPWDFLFESLYYICLRKSKNIFNISLFRNDMGNPGSLGVTFFSRYQEWGTFPNDAKVESTWKIKRNLGLPLILPILSARHRPYVFWPKTLLEGIPLLLNVVNGIIEKCSDLQHFWKRVNSCQTLKTLVIKWKWKLISVIVSQLFLS